MINAMLYASVPVCAIPVEANHLCGLTWMDGWLWFSDRTLEEILAVNPLSGEIEHRLPCPGVRTGLTHIGPNLLQVAGPWRGLRLIDPRSGHVVEELNNPRTDGELCGIEATSEGIWLGYEQPHVLDFYTHEFQHADSIPVPYGVAGLTVVGRAIAFAVCDRSEIHFVDPAGREVIATVSVKGNPTGLTTDGELIWYCDYLNSELRAIEVPGVLCEQ